jgi:hypothetical protein
MQACLWATNISRLVLAQFGSLTSSKKLSDWSQLFVFYTKALELDSRSQLGTLALQLIDPCEVEPDLCSDLIHRSFVHRRHDIDSFHSECRSLE